jgi:hypothetical protein
MNRLKRLLMIKGVEIFADYVSKDIVKNVFPETDYVKFLNGLSVAVRRIR